MSNVTGHNNELKRKCYLEHIKKLNPTIAVTVDSRVGPSTERSIRNNMSDYNCFFSSFSTQARGISVYIDKKSTLKISKLYADKEGNVLNLKIKDNEHVFVLCCIYGPTRDDPVFFEENINRLTAYDCPYIMTGDFNTTLCHAKDNLNYVEERNKESRRRLNELMREHELIDVQRCFWGEERRYTYISKSGPQMGRLDFFIASGCLFPDIVNTEIEAPFESDHCPIRLDLRFDDFKKGKNLWRHADYLLTDPDYIKYIKTELDITLARYALGPNNEESLLNCNQEEINKFIKTFTEKQSRIQLQYY